MSMPRDTDLAALLLAAAGGAREGISVVDADQRFVYVNLAQARLFGAESPEDLIGKRWDEAYQPADAAAIMACAPGIGFGNAQTAPLAGGQRGGTRE